MYQKYAKQVLRIIRSTWLNLRIYYKWSQDCRLLPLTPAHRELYYIIHRLCWRELRDFPNLINCRDFNDRIQWLKLFDQSREIIRCSDKILVRDHVLERVGEKYLVKLYQVHDHFSQIDFDALPNSFVIKTNHDSGSVILVRDKHSLNRKTAEARIESALRKPYGWLNGEWAYAYIEPKVFVEEFIAPENTVPPPDYKFHCSNGRIRWLQYIFDRGSITKECTITYGNEATLIHFGHNMKHKKIDLNSDWMLMIPVVEKIANEFKYVRVDMYHVNGRCYFGEMTFFPLMGCYKGEGQKKLGHLLDFDRSTFKPFLIPELEKERSRFVLYPESR